MRFGLVGLQKFAAANRGSGLSDIVDRAPSPGGRTDARADSKSDAEADMVGPALETAEAQ
jgi:hypothetical protein